MRGAPAREDVDVELLEKCDEFADGAAVRCAGLLLLRHEHKDRPNTNRITGAG